MEITIEELKEKLRQTPEGRLLVRYGYEPYDTEQIARQVAERAAHELSELLDIISRLVKVTDRNLVDVGEKLSVSIESVGNKHGRKL